MNKSPESNSGRIRQKMRTRRALLQAAQKLLEAGKKLSIESVAEEAMVSRATAYRYYSSVEALTIEAVIETQMPGKPRLLAGLEGKPVSEQVLRFQERWLDIMEEHEGSLRKFMSITLGDWTPESKERGTRGNRRLELFEELLSLPGDGVSESEIQHLKYALCIFTSLEALLVLKDACRLSSGESREIIRWASRILIQSVVSGRSDTKKAG